MVKCFFYMGKRTMCSFPLSVRMKLILILYCMWLIVATLLKTCFRKKWASKEVKTSGCFTARMCSPAKPEVLCDWTQSVERTVSTRAFSLQLIKLESSDLGTAATLLVLKNEAKVWLQNIYCVCVITITAGTGQQTFHTMGLINPQYHLCFPIWYSCGCDLNQASSAGLTLIRDGRSAVRAWSYSRRVTGSSLSHVASICHCLPHCMGIGTGEWQLANLNLNFRISNVF